MSTLVPLTVAVPLIAGPLLAIVGLFLSRRACDLIGVAVAAATAALCLIVLIHVGRGLELHWFGGWNPRHGLAIGVDFAVDAYGAGLAAFVALLMTLAMVFTWHEGDADQPHFQVLMLVFLAAMVGFAESGDLFNVFVFFELMSVAAFALVGYSSERRSSLEGALNFAVSNTLGSFLFLAGIGLVYARTGALNLAQIGTHLSGHPLDELVVVALALIAVGFFVKAALVPFHFWLADAYAIAPASVCLLLAGAMSEMGLFGFGRVYFTAFAGAFAGHEHGLQVVLVALGVLTGLLGAMLALRQDHLKRMLAFVTISYVGIFLCAVGLLSADGVGAAGLYVLADGCGKAGLFACVGIIQRRRGFVGAGALHGRLRDMPWTGALWFGLALMMATLPPFGAFLAKAGFDDAALKEGFWWLPSVAVLIIALNAGAVLRAGARIFLGWGAPAERHDEEQRPVRERTPVTMFVPALALLVAAAGLGVWFGLSDLMLSGAHRFTDAAAYASQVLQGRPIPVRVGESKAPEWFDWIYGAAALEGSLLVAAAALWGGRMRAIRLAAASSRPLERLHSGRIGDYAAWLALGAGGLAVLMTAVR